MRGKDLRAIRLADGQGQEAVKRQQTQCGNRRGMSARFRAQDLTPLDQVWITNTNTAFYTCVCNRAQSRSSASHALPLEWPLLSNRAPSAPRDAWLSCQIATVWARVRLRGLGVPV